MIRHNPGLADELSARHILVDGTLYSGVLSALVLGLLYYNPEIFYNDYPAEIKAKVGPPSARSKRQQIMLVPVLVLLFFGGPVYFALRLKRANGGRISFVAAFIHTFLVLTAFNLVDTILIDYLLLVRIQPRFARIPRAEDIDLAQYISPADLVRDFGKGIGFGLVGSLLIAFFVSRRGSAPNPTPQE
jgi:hypothetical protein